MGQKIHPLSLRVQSSTRFFDQAWYSDHFFSKLISIDISIYKYLNNFFTLFKLPTGRFSIFHLPQTTKLYSFFCYPRQSREYKSKIFNISTGLGNTNSSSNSTSSLHKKDVGNTLQNKRNYRIQRQNFLLNNLSYKLSNSNIASSFYNLLTHNLLKSNKLQLKNSSYFDSLNAIQNTNLEKLVKSSEINKYTLIENKLGNFYKIPEIFSYKNSTIKNNDENLAILKNVVLLSTIFKIPYNINNKKFNLPKISSQPCIGSIHENTWKYSNNIEANLSKFVNSDFSLIPFQVNSEWQDAGYFADEIVYLLERRISFRQIKNRIFKHLSLNPYIQGVRITCSGRVGGKSKKAQRAKVDSIKYGQTSLHIFSSRIDFAVRTAYTSLGSTGVKVWICYK